jgi:two-component system, NtrC family, response regulator AtoC
MARAWSGRPPEPPSPAEDAETASAGPGGKPTGVLALYVSSPNGGARHLLPEGFVALGRGAEATIRVDDRRVSRLHAGLQVEGDLSITDLASANGTFVNGERLRTGEVRPLSLGLAFAMGDSILHVQSTSLARSCPRRVARPSEIRDRLARIRSSRGDHAEMFVLRVRAARAADAAWIESVLADLVPGAEDFMLRLDAERWVLGVGTSAPGAVAHVERAAIERISSYGLVADVDAWLAKVDELDVSEEALQSRLSGSVPLALQRGNIVIRDPAMEALKKTVARVASAPVSVLILGETGVGKDVVASMVHELSSRASRPFVRLNCASLPEPLLESELFGHERGAFTGAVASKAGLVETAEGGTVFLDEVGDLPGPLQAKLLLVIESKAVLRVGALRPRTVDVRFLSATNRDLAVDVAAGRFRKDLYYRLNTVIVTVPPLRERQVEIEPLARLFLADACARFDRAGMSFSPGALDSLTSYAWPGNVRELKNVVERAVLLTPELSIEPEHLALGVEAAAPSAAPRAIARTDAPGNPPLDDVEAERFRIASALAECAGNQSRAAKVLGIARRTLVRRIADLGLPRPRGGTE